MEIREIIDKQEILKGLGYENPNEIENKPIEGWRILSKTSLSEAEIALLIKEMGSLGKIKINEFKQRTKISFNWNDFR